MKDARIVGDEYYTRRYTTLDFQNAHLVIVEDRRNLFAELCREIRRTPAQKLSNAQKDELLAALAEWFKKATGEASREPTR